MLKIRLFPWKMSNLLKVSSGSSQFENGTPFETSCAKILLMAKGGPNTRFGLKKRRHRIVPFKHCYFVPKVKKAAKPSWCRKQQIFNVFLVYCGLGRRLSRVIYDYGMQKIHYTWSKVIDFMFSPEKKWTEFHMKKHLAFGLETHWHLRARSLRTGIRTRIWPWTWTICRVSTLRSPQISWLNILRGSLERFKSDSCVSKFFWGCFWPIIWKNMCPESTHRSVARSSSMILFPGEEYLCKKILQPQTAENFQQRSHFSGDFVLRKFPWMSKNSNGFERRFKRFRCAKKGGLSSHKHWTRSFALMVWKNDRA